jgi:hypothetical protein
VPTKPAGVSPSSNADSPRQQRALVGESIHKKPELTNEQIAKKVLAGEDVPVGYHLDHAAASKAALGPLILEQSSLQEQRDQLKAATGGKKGETSKRAVDIAKIEKTLAKVTAEIAQAKARLDDIRSESARMVVPALKRDIAAYWEVLQDLDPDGTKGQKLTEMAQRLSNKGTLAVGARAQSVTNGAISDVEVVKVFEDGRHELPVFQEVNIVTEDYEEGYHTRKPVFVTAERHEIYRLSKDGKQTVRDDVPFTSHNVKFLALLFRDADVCNGMLHELGPSIQAEINHARGATVVTAHLAPLKGRERIMQKVAEMYAGDFAAVTDIARMTFECADFEAAQSLLTALAARSDIEISRIKDRLMEAFDASVAGGYRDMLVNARHKATGHCIEIQITLSGLLAIKKSGGHVTYKLVRVLGLQEKATTNHQGEINTSVVERVECGMLRSVTASGAGAGVGEHLAGLVTALASPTCMVSELTLAGLKRFPEDQKLLSAIFTPAVLGQLCPQIKVLGLGASECMGPVPSELWSCTKLEELNLYHNPGLSGSLPPTIGKLKRLKVLQLGGDRD